MTLYEINKQYLELLEAFAAGEVPEEAINDTLEAIRGEFEEKADNIACYIKGLVAEAKAIKEEASALAERAVAKDKKAQSLTDYLYNCMKSSGRTKLETARNALSIKLNPPAVVFEDEAAFVEWAKKNADHLLTYKPPVPNKVEIKAKLQNGLEVAGVEITQKERLVIK